MQIIPEKSSMTFNSSFFDENGNPIQPETASYALYDVQSEKAIIGPVNLTNPIPTSFTVEVSRDDNAILNDENEEETKIFLVEFYYRDSQGELTKGAPGEYKYKVKNLHFVE